MSETTDGTFEMITDDDTVWIMDSDGNVYSYQLTEAERLQDAASNPGSAVHVDPDQGGSNGYLADISELSDADETGDPVSGYAGAVLAGDGETQHELVMDDDTVWIMDSDGNVYSYQLTEAERLQDAASNPGSAVHVDPDQGGSNGYLADVSELSGAGETGDPAPDYADATPAGDLGPGAGADMIMAAIMEAYSFDLLF